MVIPHRLAVRADGFNSATRLLAQRAGFLLLALSASSGQQGLPVAATESLRLSVVSRVGSTCGSVFSAPGVRGYVDARLRGAGITVSTVYTAQLAAELDCVARGPRAGDRGIAVQECLGYSEVVSAPSYKSGVRFSSTWRKCQSFVCGSGKCASSMRVGLNTLMNTFFTDLGTAHQVPAPISPPVIARKTAPQEAAGASRVSTAYYALYILACMILLLYWQLRSTLTSMPHS